MSFSIITTDFFVIELKHLSKKYPSIKQDISNLVKQILENPFQGVPIGNDCYKIRIAITSKQKGKSGGARVITHVQITKETIYLLSIYDKSEIQDLSDKDIENRLKNLK